MIGESRQVFLITPAAAGVIFWPLAVTNCYTYSLDFSRCACYNKSAGAPKFCYNWLQLVTIGADFTMENRAASSVFF